MPNPYTSFAHALHNPTRRAAYTPACLAAAGTEGGEMQVTPSEIALLLAMSLFFGLAYEEFGS